MLALGHDSVVEAVASTAHLIAGLGALAHVTAHRLAALRLLTLPAITRDAALAVGFTRFFTRPLVRSALLMCGFTAFAGDLPLLVPIHRCESAILFGHY